MPEWFDEVNGYAKNTQPGELYNLREDLSQKRSRYADEPARAAELKRLVDAAKPSR